KRGAASSGRGESPPEGWAGNACGSAASICRSVPDDIARAPSFRSKVVLISLCVPRCGNRNNTHNEAASPSPPLGRRPAGAHASPPERNHRYGCGLAVDRSDAPEVPRVLHRNEQGEPGALPRRALDLQFAVMGLDNAPHVAEPQAQPTEGPGLGGIHLDEVLEDLAHLPGGDPDAAVGDRHPHPIWLPGVDLA